VLDLKRPIREADVARGRICADSVEKVAERSRRWSPDEGDARVSEASAASG